jgi:hypothetical protein
MFFSKKQHYISLDDSDEEVKVGGSRLPTVMHTTVEIGLRWLLAVSVLLCLSIVSAWALFFSEPKPVECYFFFFGIDDCPLSLCISTYFFHFEIDMFISTDSSGMANS